MRYLHALSNPFNAANARVDTFFAAEMLTHVSLPVTVYVVVSGSVVLHRTLKVGDDDAVPEVEVVVALYVTEYDAVAEQL